MKLRNAHGAELEAYFVFSVSPLVEIPSIEGVRLEVYPNDDGSLRAARITGDADGHEALERLRARLLSGELRWLEIGLRGYSLMEGKREYRPWRRNAHLSVEDFVALTALEPEVRYHAPV
jgi:hypothetical protein